ncbi:hypothetical protein ACFYO9_37390 [Streptomyces sp. NPDC005863]|uniref:hypothetical protein n=1 Tax=Streptomyces sp. NPDC005863 TaxID=3364735 RepID=UPI0036C29CC9
MMGVPRFGHEHQAGIAIGQLLHSVDPAPDAAPFMRFRFETPSGEWSWEGHVSEAGAVLVAGLLEAEEDRQRYQRPRLAVVRPLRLVR